MALRRLAEEHRAIFFAGIFAAYLAVLYGFSSPHDESLFHASVRIAAPGLELGLAWIACNALYRFGRRKRSVVGMLIYFAIPLLVVLVYAVQMYSLYISGNFITVLAIENRAESRIIRNGSLYIAFSLAFAWWLFFIVAYRYGRKVRGTDAGRSRMDAWRSTFVAILSIGVIALFHSQKDNGLLAADYRQAPLVAFARSYYDARSAPVDLRGNNSATTNRGELDGLRYPLEKKSIYSTPLPFNAKGVQDSRPNVIVLFTEGTSARLLGCYGGRYSGLTPNIDRLAQVSMRVTNYYNHTAATYRGLQGQMVSGYPSAGGGDDSALWETGEGKSTLASIRYRSISMILHDSNYGTYFISPHHDTVGLNTLLRSLEFDKVFTFDDISRDIVPGNPYYAVEGALSDDDVFNALRALMAKGALAQRGHPFFMGIYNFGTHAFLDIMPNGEKYGDGTNAALNKLHNYDHALGQFLDYFFASPFASNTILILTADHATYPEQPFRRVAGSDYKPFFVDRIPLIVYDPTHQLPATYDAQGRTSIDFAPTLMQLLGVRDGGNSFLGASLFEKSAGTIGFAAIGNEFYATDTAGIYPEGNVPAKYARQFSEEKRQVETYYQLERENRVFPASRAGSTPADIPTGPP